MFVVIASYRDANGVIHAGTTTGPFETRTAAEKWVEERNYPSPELVQVKSLHAPSE